MRKEWLGMILAGGQGARLKLLTKKIAKPAVGFGGRYRIIDFPLSNCQNSGLDTVGVLTQYKPFALHSYIGTGTAWDLDRTYGGVYTLPPYADEKGGEWYKGTADAIYQNIEFLDIQDPEYVLILSGDHIYKMDYSEMLQAHKKNNADCTIAVFEVPWAEASRFGIMATDETGAIVEFAEKPKEPKSNLASMGVYIFSYAKLREYLIADAPLDTEHDFGKNILPNMLNDNQRMFAFRFQGYWKDVGTVDSLWEANMDLLEDVPAFNLYDPSWRIFSVSPVRPPHYVGLTGEAHRSMIGEGCRIYGKVDHSILFSDVVIEEGAVVKDSVLFPGTIVRKGAYVEKAIVAENSELGEFAIVGRDAAEGPFGDNGGVVLIGEATKVPAGARIRKDATVGKDNV
ncbi:MAG: glucose-1-phosphate adenylyltransferase [Negativicutes bacterium]|jgi:glucose-1-phosphate adenylyltransferase